MTAPAAYCLEVERTNLRRWRWADFPVPKPAEGQVLVRVDRFALTANNVTYGLLGDRLRYWEFFPTTPGWGRIPAWGIGDVIASRSPELPVGDRIYGYLPMGTHVLMQPGRAGRRAFAEGSLHRSTLDPAYNHYLRLTGDPAYDRAGDNHLCLLRPLVMTGMVVQHHLLDARCFGARRIVIGGASSKTGLASAVLLASALPPDMERVALTSPGNAEFCRQQACYHRAVAYPDVAALAPGVPTAFLDMAGNGAVRQALHEHLGADLVYSGQVGFTHWEQGQAPAALPGAAPTFFSSLQHIRQRNQEWGPAEFERRFQAAWQAVLPATEGWLHIQPGRGRAGVEAAYPAVVEGRTRPDQGMVLSL